MTYIEIINRFWKIHQFDHFSSAEIAVYFYLLNMANRNMWEDEIAVATAELCASIGMRRSTIIRARQSLREKGLIECRAHFVNKMNREYIKTFNKHKCKTFKQDFYENQRPIEAPADGTDAYDAPF